MTRPAVVQAVIRVVVEAGLFVLAVLYPDRAQAVVAVVLVVGGGRLERVRRWLGAPR